MLVLLIACAEAPVPAPPPPPPKKGPVVLVTLDTTRADVIGAWGGSAHTPALDGLAARGTRFERAYAAVPLTIPSHSSIHTALWPMRHGVRDNGDARLSEQATTLAEVFQGAGWRTAACVGAFVTQAHWGFGQGFDVYREELPAPAERLGWSVERPGREVVNDALAELDAGAELLWVHLFDAHAPHGPGGYTGDVEEADRQLGRLLQGLPPNALVAVAGDHGEGLGEGGEEAHGLLLSEGVLRVPLVLAGPGVPEGRVISEPVSLVDVAPTLLRLAGLPPLEGVDGVDLLEGERRPVWSEILAGHLHFGWTPLYALTSAEGRFLRGVRDEGPPGLLPELERLAALVPLFSESAITLDLTQVQQLQALGYVGGAGAPSGVDPREGILALADARKAKTEAEIRAVLARHPWITDLRLRLGTGLFRSGRVDEALAELTTAFQGAPSASIAMVLGQAWAAAAAPEEALGWFREARARDPRSMGALAGEVQSLARLGRLDEARALVSTGDMHHAEVVLAAATLALAGGEDPTPWIPKVEAVLARQPGRAGINLLLAELRLAAGDSPAAEAHLEAELRLSPGDVGARLDLYRLCTEQGRHLEAVKAIRPLREAFPEDPRWAEMTARSYAAMGRPDLAEQHQPR